MSMSSAEAKLNFKNRVFKLAGSIDDPPLQSDDPYWNMFWEEPDLAEDIFNILTFTDLKTIRDSNKPNFLNWIRIITIELIQLTESLKIKSNDSNNNHRIQSQQKQLLNCIRTLTRLVPFLYEKQAEFIIEINSLFWNLSYNSVDFSNPNSSLSNNATVGSFSTDTNSSQFTNSSTKVQINNPIHQQNLDSNGPNSTEVHVGGIAKQIKPLGQQLILSLLELLFLKGFTIDGFSEFGRDSPGVDFKTWEVGIGSNGKYSNPNPRLDSNRLEIIRLILTLTSQGMYKLPKQIVTSGSRFMTVLVSTVGRLQFLTFICSLLNLICRSFNPDSEKNGLSYKESEYSGNKFIVLRKSLVTYSLNLLTSMIVYPIPSNDTQFLYKLNILQSNEKIHNLVRSYFGRLHKENELNFLVNSFLNFLKKPMEQAVENELNPFNIIKSNFTNSSASSLSSASGTLNGSNNTSNSSNSHQSGGNSLPLLSPWTTELVIFLWELIQCNKNFKNFIYSKKSHELIISLFYYIKYYKHLEIYKSNIIRIICFFALYLTSDEVFVSKLIVPINQNYYHNQLPNFYKINNSSNSMQSINNLTYRDFIIIQISQVLSNDMFDVLITPNLFEYLYNMIPLQNSLVQHAPDDPPPTVYYKSKNILSYYSSLSLVNVISKITSSDDFLKNNLKLDLLALLIRAIVHCCCRFQKESRTLLYVLTKHEQVFKGLLSKVEEFQTDQFPQHELNDIAEEESTRGENYESEDNYSEIDEEDEDEEEEDDDEYGRNDQSTLGDDENGISKKKFKNKDEFETSLRPKPPAGMSSKAKSKLPLDAPLTKTWAGFKSLMVLFELIELVKTEIPNIQESTKAEIVENLIKIEGIKDYESKVKKFTPSEFLPKTKFESLKFIWSTISLGWYESILWGDIFYQNNQAKDNLGGSNNLLYNWGFNKRISGLSNLKDVASSWGFSWNKSSTSSSVPNSPISSQQPQQINFQFDHTVLQLKIWNGTTIKLFKIKKPVVEKPLVDMNNLMKRFRLNSASSINTLNTIDSRASNNNASLNSPRHESISSNFNSPNQLTPINSRQSFTPRNSIHINSRQNSFSNMNENPFFKNANTPS